LLVPDSCHSRARVQESSLNSFLLCVK
jgi:hypothetical protein